jgi:uncharacterized protein (TIGR03083 family)
MIVDERRSMADLLAGLTDDLFGRPSLCAGWTVHDVAAHVVSYLRFGQAKVYAGIVATAADFDRMNVLLTRWQARRSSHEIVDLLRRRAGSTVTMPRSGYGLVLADLMLHDLDIRLPLGISRSVPEERLWVAFDHLTGRPGLGFGVGNRLAGVRLVATDTGWARGAGASVHGRAEALLLAASGRRVAFDELDGDGVALLRQRVLSPPPKPGPLHRLAIPLRLLVNPVPGDRRTRHPADREPSSSPNWCG